MQGVTTRSPLSSRRHLPNQALALHFRAMNNFIPVACRGAPPLLCQREQGLDRKKFELVGDDPVASVHGAKRVSVSSPFVMGDRCAFVVEQPLTVACEWHQFVHCFCQALRGKPKRNGGGVA